MNTKPEGAGAKASWFVGASYDGEDQTPRFLEEGIWENGYQDKYLELVKSIQIGDKIAIKSSYTRKHNLPFDNHGHTVSVMAIKATGTVINNLGDGRNLLVEWQPIDSPREWFFYTSRVTIWRVLPGDWDADALLEFTFEGKEQNLDRFRNAPYWAERFGDTPDHERRFKWTSFYEAVAEKLLAYKNNRNDLIAGIKKIGTRQEGLSYLEEENSEGVSSMPKDIDPFTVMGIFNRGISDPVRIAIAQKLADFLQVDEPVPNSFEGIPLLNAQRSWFFGREAERSLDHFDILWDFFEVAITFAEKDDPETRSKFTTAYDKAMGLFMIGWNLTMGLYWIRPWSFTTLDKQSRIYLNKKLNITIGSSAPGSRADGAEYLILLDTLQARFKEDGYPVHSFPDLSQAAWLFKDTAQKTNYSEDEDISELDEKEIADNTAEENNELIEPYSIDNIFEDGCFIPREKVEKTLSRLKSKRNLILQGPPGTGKTWVAKRLAFALIGQRDERKIKSVQFHPNLSYEDFIRGWRPTGEGKLSLVDGPFMEMVNRALKDPKSRYVIVIEEINRGNPAQIFGEMLTLLEADKRTPSEAMELTYKVVDSERVFIPDNLYVIGTMNIADRSLALVDLALRRRFAFIDLEPTFGTPWHDWVKEKSGIDSEMLLEIEKRILALNETISEDNSLGPQFRIGHSYVTPAFNNPITDGREWFRQVVITEIGPLLEEYWFDEFNKKKALEEKDRLLEGF